MKFYANNSVTVVISGVIDTGHHQSEKGVYHSFYLEYQELDCEGCLANSIPMYHQIMFSKQEDSEFMTMVRTLGILREDGMIDLDDLFGLVIEIGQTFPEGSRYPVFRILKSFRYYKTAEECNGFVAFEIDSLSVEAVETLSNLPVYVRKRIFDSVEAVDNSDIDKIKQISAF